MSQGTLLVRLAESAEDLAIAAALRHAVFCQEQGYPVEVERDGLDDVSDQLLLVDQDTGEVVGVVRWITTLSKLGRLAVKKSHRGTGAGKLLVLGLEKHLQSRTGRAGQANEGKSECTINVSSQQPVVSFYTRLGYEIVGEPYIEAQTPHIYCKKTVTLG